jgi:hypothetical protein
MLRILTRSLRLALEFIAGFAAIFVLIGVLLVWRLSASPVSSSFLTPYVEKGIAELLPGTKVTIGRSLLTWDNADRSITLEAGDVHMSGNDVTIVDVPNLDIRISVLGLLLGRVVPAGLVIEHPQVSLVRQADGTLLFGGMAAQGGGNGDLRTTLTHIFDDLAEAHFMRKLEITEAAFAIHDEKTGEDWAISVPDTVLEHHLGGALSGEAKIEVRQKDQAALVVVHYERAVGSGQHDLTARFSGINPAFFASAGSKMAILNVPLTGEMIFAFDDRLQLVEQSLDVHGDAGTLDDPDLWDAPRTVAGLDLKADYDRETGKLHITDAVIDFGGPKLALTLEGTEPPAGTTPARDLDFTLAVSLTGLPMDQFGAVWPKSVITDARNWMAANMTHGTFDRGDATFKGALIWNDLGNIQVTEGKGTLAASNATVNYIDGMSPVVGVNASADFDLKQMAITVSGGGIGDLKLQPSTIHITDLDTNSEKIDLPIHLAGPVPSVLKLIDEPPLGYAKAIGLAPDSMHGALDGTVAMKFPLLRKLAMKDVDIKANAAITGLSSAQLVPGYDITQGNLALRLDKSGFDLEGTAALNTVPLHVAWQEAFIESAGKPLRQVDVSASVTGDQWVPLGLDALSKTQGPIDVTLQMLQKDEKSTVYSGALDLKAAAMQVDRLNWSKPSGVPASLAFEAQGTTGQDIKLNTVEAIGPALTIKGAGTLASDFSPVALDFGTFIANRTDATLHFSQAPGPQGKLSFDAEGKAFDVSGLRGGNDPDRADPRPKEYRLKLGKLYTSDFGFIANVSGSAVRDSEGWSEISLHGLADGGHQLDIDLAPKPDGHRVFSITCDDFGKALKGLGFTDTVKSGKVEISGASTPQQPRQIEGKVKIGSFQVHDLPALVVLMNATSPFGIVDLVTGKLDFDRMEGIFIWRGDMLELRDFRAAGDSVGMTIDGSVDMNSGASDLHGTMAPFSMFNRIIGYIPLLGDVLTGGEGQGFFGVNYSIKGTLDKPDVSVNPASLLTPGFLRNLFFGGGSESKTPAGNAPAFGNGTNNPPPPGNAARPDEAPAPSAAPVPAVQQTLPPAQTNINKK